MYKGQQVCDYLKVASGAIAYGTKRTFDAIENAVTKKDKT